VRVLVVRIFAAVIGGLLVVMMVVSAARSLVVPRGRTGGLPAFVDKLVDKTFVLITRRAKDYVTRDRLLAAQPVAMLGATLAGWLLALFVGYLLLLWPWVPGLFYAAREAGSSLVTLGFATTDSIAATLLDVLAAASGLAIVALQISYLPTLYAAFNRRENEVALLAARAGSPSWGPELLARTRYGISLAEDDLVELYKVWERWAADIAESHTNYPILVRFRSPRPMQSWLIGLLAVMDSAALLLALCPSRDRIEPRFCLRMGFSALRQIAPTVGLQVDEDPDPDGELQLSYEDYLFGVNKLIDVGFPVERTAEDAWPHFRGWRVNYESIVYALAAATDAVPALWSGPRRWPSEPMPPVRPPARRPSGHPSSYRPPTST
jgi:hypothetical protein